MARNFVFLLDSQKLSQIMLGKVKYIGQSSILVVSIFETTNNLFQFEKR